jgi:hypothetical protein
VHDAVGADQVHGYAGAELTKNGEVGIPKVLGGFGVVGPLRADDHGRGLELPRPAGGRGRDGAAQRGGRQARVAVLDGAC